MTEKSTVGGIDARAVPEAKTAMNDYVIANAVTSSYAKAKGVAFILLIMSMWSLGVGIERFFTYTQARNQSKLYVNNHIHGERNSREVKLPANWKVLRGKA